MHDVCYLNCIMEYQRQAMYEMQRFVEQYRAFKPIVKKYEYCVILDGKKIYFLGEHVYERWCKGRYYVYHGDLYCNGYKIEENYIEHKTD